MISKKDLNEVVVVMGVFLFLTYCLVVHLAEEYPPPENCEMEIKQLSKIINAEANETDTLDMYLVGSVILNRVDSQSFPNSQDKVIKQRSQFAGYMSKKYENTELTDSIAARLLRGENRDYEVLYFYNIQKATDRTFIRRLSNKHKFITNTKSHAFYGAQLN